MRRSLFGYCFNADLFQKKIPQITWHTYPQGAGRPRHVLEEGKRSSTPLCLNLVQYNNLPLYLQNHSILDLTRHFSGKRLDCYASLALDACTLDGRLMAIPEDFGPFALIARRDLLAQHRWKSPSTIMEFSRQLEDLKKELGTCPLAILGRGFKNRMGFLGSVLCSWGVDLNAKFEDWFHDGKKFASAYDWIRELRSKNLIDGFEMFIRGLSQRSNRQGPLEKSPWPFIATWSGKKT